MASCLVTLAADRRGFKGKDPSKYPQVEAWMKWYIAHLNSTDVWGLGGTAEKVAPRL